MTYPGTVKTVLIGKESAWGTPVSATKDIGLVTDVSMNLSREVIESMGLGAIDVQAINGGMVDVKSGVTVEFQHGRLLEYIFGTVAHATSGSDEKHTFTISSTPPSFTMESGNNLATDTTLTGAGFLVESAEFNVEMNKVLTLKCDLVGKTVTSSASASAAVLSTLPVFPHPLVTIQINDVTATEVQKFSVKIVKKVERSGGMTSALYQQGHAVELHIEFSGTLGFQDKTHQELWLGGTTPAATANPTAYDVTLDAKNGVAYGSGQRALFLDLQSSIGSTFDEVASIGNLTFFDIAGKAVLKECYSVDNIASGSW